jgi:hypothetical protein
MKDESIKYYALDLKEWLRFCFTLKRQYPVSYSHLLRVYRLSPSSLSH